MNVGGRYGHNQGEAVLIDQNVDFYSFDFLSAADTTFSTGRRRPAGPTVRYEDGGLGLVTAGHPPPTEKIDHKALPKPQAIPPYEGQKSGQSQRVDYAGETSRTNTLPSQVVPYNAKVVQNFQEKLRAKYMAELPEICQFSAYIVFNLPA